MAIGDIVVGIDIGTSKVCAVVGEVNSFNQVEIISTTEAICSGIKKCKIMDSDNIANAIRNVINEAQDILEMKINSAYINIPGQYLTIVQNSITVEAKDKYAGILTKDVLNGINTVKDIDVPEDKVLIDLVPDEFVLDNGKIVEDPTGSLSTNFTLKAQVILADKVYVKELSMLMKKAGLEIDGIISNVLAQRNLVLDANEFTDNVMIMDIGAGNTDIGVFEGNSYIYANTIPLGGSTITSDISLVLDISEEEAEKLKKQYGLALKSFIDNDIDISLNTYKGDDILKTIKSFELIEIIEARIEEIFSIVNKDITAQNIKQKINNVIITGLGLSNINKSDIAGKIILNIPVKNSTARLTSTIKPVYNAACGVVRYVASRPFARTVSSNVFVKNDRHILKSAIDKIKDFFYS